MDDALVEITSPQVAIAGQVAVIRVELRAMRDLNDQRHADNKESSKELREGVRALGSSLYGKIEKMRFDLDNTNIELRKELDANSKATFRVLVTAFGTLIATMVTIGVQVLMHFIK